MGLMLLACGREPSGEAVQESVNVTTAEPAPPAPQADIDASLAPLGADPPRPLAERERFVGRWAADEAMCARAAWRFDADRLETPAGSVCRFTEVREVPGGYDIAARCTAEAPERDDILKLRFPESAGGMLFESESIADAGLVRCGG